MTASSRADVQIDTSTRHDIRIVLTDDALSAIDPNDEVYFHLAGRGKEVTRKMSFRDIEHLLASGEQYTSEGEFHPTPRPLKKARFA